MKPIKLFARQMWIGFAMQILFSFLICAPLILVCSFMLRAVEATNHDLTARILPTEQQRLASEQDVPQLRREVSELWELAVENGKTEEQLLSYGIYGLIGFGFGLLVNSFNTAIWAYKLARLETSDQGKAGG
jgi:hypothetical protein